MDYQFVIEGYCPDSECPMREVQMHFKDYDAVVRADATWRCPRCGAALTEHWRRDAARYEQVREQDARVSVAIQMYQRDTGSPFWPLSIARDRLPPTPEGWWENPSPQPAHAGPES